MAVCRHLDRGMLRCIVHRMMVGQKLLEFVRNLAVLRQTNPFDVAPRSTASRYSAIAASTR